MSEGSPTRLRDLATGVLSGFAALATAAAGVVGVLHETGYLGSHATVSPAAMATSSTLSQPAQASVGVASNSIAPGLPSLASTEAQRALAAAIPVPKFAPNQEHQRPRAHGPVSPPDAVAAIAPESTAPAVAPPREFPPAQPAKSEQPMIALNGAWTDFGPGYCHAIKQAGNRFQIVNFAPVTGAFISAGHGTISGRSIHLQLNDLHPAAATGELYLSNDGQKLMDTLRRQDGEHPLAWHRKGSPCG